MGTQKSKVKVVLSWPTPRNLKEVRGFVGLCSYYRIFVKDFAKHAEPLHALMRKGARWNWDDQCQKAFEVMKHKLTSAPVMALPQDDAEYILDTDASNCHIGAVSLNSTGWTRRKLWSMETNFTRKRNRTTV